ncbi:MAG: permease [Limnospira sp. PMC 1291.21]|uniref:Permease n=3 Tax=Limnospira TaxID=2596745 RepID=A0A9P1P015_9CYAN|nr:MULTISPECIES: permease [Limnospira]AMW28866.1 permease [Arthrospira platensis YZ]EKD11745.1 permease [Arthrospira platensis C1]MBD2669768.1 permease [Arthrospira platensis FACHB-439]MDC0840051.1 permease [Limnoraphis robusta]MDT9182994.1 permease [Limnospira sp. PMC 289.06]MDY7053514.1 permease [Limnospira fusiformis LS22]QJB27330.1 permease [Limnospira fusiformis SAG 85.79]
MPSIIVSKLNAVFTLFLSLLVEAMPFLLLGVMLSSLLLWLVDERKLLYYVPTNPFLGAIFGSLFGFMFPVCECGNVPVARRLLSQGVPASAAIGFLFAAPTINPIVIWSTWVAFRGQPEVVVLRILFSLIIAITLGLVFSAQKDLRPFLQKALARLVPQPDFTEKAVDEMPKSSLLTSGTYIMGQSATPVRLQSMPMWKAEGKGVQAVATMPQTSVSFSSIFIRPTRDRVGLMIESGVQEFRELGGMLVVGSAIAAIIQTVIPREIILSLGYGPISSILAMLLLAGVVSICSTVDAFFALSFAATFTTGSLLAFLVFGPMIDIKTVGLMMSIFQTRAIIYLMILAAQLTFLLTLAVNLNLNY